MKRVFVYEYLSAGGLMDDADAAGDELLPAGLAMRDAMVSDLLHCGDCAVSVAACPRTAAVPGPAAAVAPLAGESALVFVARQAALHDRTWVVAPETGRLLARLQRVVGAPRWLGCDTSAIAIASSKRATLARLAALGLPTPLAFAHSPETRRWVVKPDDGAGGIATRVHSVLAAAQDDAARRGDAATVIEPWVGGDALSVSLLCGARGVEMLSVNRQHIEIDADGTLAFRGVEVNAIGREGSRGVALSALAARVAHGIPGLRGFVGIDLVWHPERGPVVIEVNPRVTCAYVGLSAALGRNLAAELIAIQDVELAHDDA